jgi:ribosome biogenesis GTPase A
LAKFGIDAARAYERPDLAEHLAEVLARLDRPDTVIAVAGEFKQGKSSLINGLLGETICPVDDDLATSVVTVLRHGEMPRACLRRRVGEQDEVQEIAVEQLVEAASERGNPENRDGVELAEVWVPNPFLARGITLVDTPGIGGLTDGYMAATLAFLRTSDAVLFVSDASAELSAPEMDFLAQARAVCPLVLLVITKSDLYPEWRRIVELNRTHLAQAGAHLPIVSVSSTLRAAALVRGDRRLNDESGYPLLLEALRSGVLGQARDVAAAEALRGTRLVAEQLIAAYRAELGALQDPELARATLDELERTREQLNHMRGPAARWNIVLNDGFAALNSQVDYGFRSAMRQLLRRAEEAVEESDPADTWEELSSSIQADVARHTDAAFARIETDAAQIRDSILALLQAEDIGIFGPQRGGITDVRRYWSERTLERPSTTARVFQGLGALRGSYTGLLMLGMLSNLLGIAMIGPALIGVGLVFGGKQLIDERRRHVQRRRQQARQFVRQFIEDVQFEVSARVRDTTRELQRDMRDHFNDRLAELVRTCSEALEATQRNVRDDEAQRARRVNELSSRIGKLEELVRRVDRAEQAR